MRFSGADPAEQFGDPDSGLPVRTSTEGSGRHRHAVPEMADEVVAGRYRLTSLVGEGGMGRVWAARDELLGREVAVKELVLPNRLNGAERDDLRARMIREARSIARIDHPNVVRIFDVVYERGEPWIVMELVESRSLYEVVRTDGPLPPARAAEIGLGVLAALRAAHQAGLLHRDVKPANVLLATGGRVVLTDFGLATTAGDSSITSTGVVLGSPSYLAPERAFDEPTGPAADLWSLGATLYTAVEGRPPYSRSSPVATLAALATELPRPPRQAGELKPVLDALLRKDPADRADAVTTEQLLQAAAAGTPAMKATIARRPRKQLREGLLIGGLAVTVVVATAGVFALRPESDPAQAEARSVSVPPSRPGPGTRPKAPATSNVATAAPTSAPVKPKPSMAGTKTPASAPTDRRTSAAVSSRRVENMLTHGCLGLQTDGGILGLSDCDDKDRQRFRFASDGTLRVLGKCVQIQSADNGALLHAATCSGSASQQFTYGGTGELVSVAADKCVDATAGDGSVPVQLWPCNGTTKQKWRY